MLEPNQPHDAAPTRITPLAAVGSLLLALVAALILLSVPAQVTARAQREAETLAPAVSQQRLSASGTITYTTFLPLLPRQSFVHASEWLGVQVYGLGSRTNEHILALDAGWIRIPLSWSDVEPADTTPEYFQWSAQLDANLAALSRQGVHTILTLMDNPSWAATYPAGPIDRTEMADLVEFMAAAVAHYGAPPYNVKQWEFYNEPDNGDPYFASLGGVGYFGYTPGAYVDILRAVYAPIKQVDPDAQVVFGGIAYDAWDEPHGGPFAKYFLDGVLDQGGGDYFDVMNFHYYFAFAANWQEWGIDIVGKVRHLREKLATHGIDKPFICTETGMLSNGDGGNETQARYVPQVVARSRSVDLDAIIWFALVDSNVLGAQLWGLVDPNYYPKPAYTAYQVAVDQLRWASFARTRRADEVMEVYEFEAATERVLVAWSNDGAPHVLALSGSELLLVDKFGAESTIRDGDDGDEDGWLHPPIDVSPVYLHLVP